MVEELENKESLDCILSLLDKNDFSKLEGSPFARVKRDKLLTTFVDCCAYPLFVRVESKYEIDVKNQIRSLNTGTEELWLNGILPVASASGLAYLNYLLPESAQANTWGIATLGYFSGFISGMSLLHQARQFSRKYKSRNHVERLAKNLEQYSTNIRIGRDAVIAINTLYSNKN